MTFRDVDENPDVVALFAALRSAMPALQVLLDEVNGHWVYEDGIYRLYHQSFKVYGLQQHTTAIVAALQALAPERKLNNDFLLIVGAGTGLRFVAEHNKRWLEVTRPIVEAFLHARYFLEMGVRYGSTLEAAPMMMPSGWAAFLYLYDLR
jgi:hypothetical protein